MSQPGMKHSGKKYEAGAGDGSLSDGSFRPRDRLLGSRWELDIGENNSKRSSGDLGFPLPTDVVLSSSLCNLVASGILNSARFGFGGNWFPSATSVVGGGIPE